MTILNYPRHFVLLIGATAVLALGLSVQPVWAPAPDRLVVLFGLSGALHAVAVVLALQEDAPWMSRVGFVVAATVLSIAAPLGGLGLAALLQLNMVLTVFVALALASAFGATSYWLLVRRVWAPFLSRGSLILTIAACELAMIITALATTLVPVPRDPLAPALWWLGFSGSLCIGDLRRARSAPGR
jgi:hypothetical protein